MDITIIAILTAHLLVGIVFCFLGNRWLKIILGVYGLAFGFVLSGVLLSLLSSYNGAALLLLRLGAGAAAAAIFVLIPHFGVFFIGFGGGMLVCILAASIFNLNILNWYVYGGGLLTCCLLGALTLGFRRIFVAVFTSFTGAYALAQFVYQIINTNVQSLIISDIKAVYSTFSSMLFLAMLFGLFFLGVIVQLTVTDKAKR